MNRSIGTVFFATSTKRFLLLLRDGDTDKFNNTWAFVGGKVHSNESIYEGLDREIIEEIGVAPEIIKRIPIEKFTNTKKGFEYHTVVTVIENEFIPELNDEHKGYAWVTIDGWPKPLHPGVFNTLQTEEIINKVRLVTDLFD